MDLLTIMKPCVRRSPADRLVLSQLVMVGGLLLALAACSSGTPTMQQPSASPTPTQLTLSPSPTASETPVPTASPSPVGETLVPTASPTPVGETLVPTAPTPVGETPALTTSPSPAAGKTPLPTASPSSSVAETPLPAPSPSPNIRLPIGGRQGRGFVPLDNPAFISAAEASFLGDEELVLGYADQGEARAYPIRMMRFHHIANDTVKGVPTLVTY